jgi:HSP20 family protein
MYGFGRGAWTPLVDVYGGERHTVVVVELPGVDPNETHLDVTPVTLTLSGTRKSLSYPELSPLGLEIQSGQFERVVHLPSRVDTDTVEAVLENGLLIVTLHHAFPAPVTIQVRESGKEE